MSCKCPKKKPKFIPAVPARRSGKIKDRITYRIEGPGIELVSETDSAYGFRLMAEDEVLCWVPNNHLIATQGEDEDLEFIVITEWLAIEKGLYEKPDYSAYEVERGSSQGHGFRYDMDRAGIDYPNEY